MEPAVIVRNLAGEAIAEISPVPNTVSDLKSMIEQKNGIPFCCQKVVHADMGELKCEEQALDASKLLEIKLIVHAALPLLMSMRRFISEAHPAAEQLQKVTMDFNIHSDTETFKKEFQSLYRALVQSERRLGEESLELIHEQSLTGELETEFSSMLCRCVSIQEKIDGATSIASTLFSDGEKVIEEWKSESIKNLDKELRNMMVAQKDVICPKQIEDYAAGVVALEEKLARVKVSQDSKEIAFAERCLDQAKLLLQAYEAAYAMWSALQKSYDAVDAAEQTLVEAKLKGESEVIAVAERGLERAKQQNDRAQEQLEDARQQYDDSQKAISQLYQVSRDMAPLFAASRMISKAHKAKRMVARRKGERHVSIASLDNLGKTSSTT